MAITVYWASGSCPSWRVLMTLEHKQLAYDSRLLEVGKREHKSADHLAMNPRGNVPVLRDGDHAPYESIAIIAYLDAKYPERPVLGRSPEETGLIWRHGSEVMAYLEPALDPGPSVREVRGAIGLVVGALEHEGKRQRVRELPQVPRDLDRELGALERIGPRDDERRGAAADGDTAGCDLSRRDGHGGKGYPLP